MTQLEALRAALKPFADEAKWWPKRWNDDVEVHVKSEGDKPNEYHVATFKLGDLRRAAEAYAALEAATLQPAVGDGWKDDNMIEYSEALLKGVLFPGEMIDQGLYMRVLSVIRQAHFCSHINRANAARYEFLRNPDNWVDDGDEWLILGESSFSQFDQIVDEQMSRAATRRMLKEQTP